MKNKKVSAILGVVAVVAGVLFFQNCSQKVSLGGKAEINNPMQILESKTTGMHWRTTAGTVSPNYQYDLQYNFDFQAKKLTITATQGSAVASLPNAGVKTLTDAQVSEIRLRLSRISYQKCSSGLPPLGGGVDELGIYSNSLSTVDYYIYQSDCTGYTGSNMNQSTAGYQDLTSYLKTL